MRKSLLFAASFVSLAVAGMVYAQATQRYLLEGFAVEGDAGTFTRDAPTGATEGMSLGGVTSYRLTVCAPKGTLLMGTGVLRVWLYNPNGPAVGEGVWAYNKGLEISVTETLARCQQFGDYASPMPATGFRLLVEPVGVGASVLADGGLGDGGTVKIDACMALPGQAC